MDLTKRLESTLKTCIGTRMKNLAAKVEILKEIMGGREKNTIQNPLPTWLFLYQITQSDF